MREPGVVEMVAELEDLVQLNTLPDLLYRTMDEAKSEEVVEERAVAKDVQVLEPCETVMGPGLGPSRIKAGSIKEETTAKGVWEPTEYDRFNESKVASMNAVTKTSSLWEEEPRVFAIKGRSRRSRRKLVTGDGKGTTVDEDWTPLQVGEEELTEAQSERFRRLRSFNEMMSGATK